MHERDLRRRTAFLEIGRRENPRGTDGLEFPLLGFPPPRVAKGPAGSTSPAVVIDACVSDAWVVFPGAMTPNPSVRSKKMAAASPPRGAVGEQKWNVGWNFPTWSGDSSVRVRGRFTD